jgi:hypothetical protein
MWGWKSGTTVEKRGDGEKKAIRLDVPFLPDREYIRFLNRHADRMESVHVGLPVADARHPLRSVPVEGLAEGLRSLGNIPRYGLLNARFHDPAVFTGSDALTPIIDPLTRLTEEGLLQGIIFADAYLLRALSDAAPGIVSRLEAVPSVNLMPDRLDRVAPLMALIEETRFQPPSRWILDRSLNRDRTALAEMAERLRGAWPGIRIGLLANEGCLHQCPFKPAHDAHIALSHLDIPADTHGINRDFGCMRFLREHPHRILASPFIRPEDVPAYAPHIDVLKICGRTLGPKFLQRALRAYMAERWEGNLLSLLDAAEWMGREYHIANADLPPDFLDRMARRDHRRDKCAVCRDLFAAHGYRKALPFPDFRAPG